MESIHLPAQCVTGDEGKTRPVGRNVRKKNLGKKAALEAEREGRGTARHACGISFRGCRVSFNHRGNLERVAGVKKNWKKN